MKNEVAVMCCAAQEISSAGSRCYNSASVPSFIYADNLEFFRSLKTILKVEIIRMC